MTATSTLCHIDQFSVAYSRTGEPALIDVTLTITRGRKLAIIGESGSGKSTLAKAIANLLPGSATVTGEITWKGPSGNIANAPLSGKDIGYVFQDPGASLNPLLTVGEQVSEGAVRHLGLSWSQARERARDLLEKVNLPHPTHLLSAYPHQLSGGQRQRVAIAAAIAAEPSILITDEATSALDTVSQSSIISLLNDLVVEDDRTLVFVTHDIGLASSLADDIAVLSRGRMVETGQAGRVLTTPTQDYTRSLLANYIDFDTPSLIDRARP